MPAIIKDQEPLASHTVFRIGGPARHFVEAADREAVVTAIRAARRSGRPWIILGAGSNVLAADRGFDGTVIHPTGGEIRIEGNRLAADAAASMARVVSESLAHGLAGFEWAIGVPGTIGGSVRGNAGCFGSEMKDVTERVSVYDAVRDLVAEWPAAEAAFGYRESVFKHRPELVILGATLALGPGDAEAARQKVQGYARARMDQVPEALGREFFNPGGHPSRQEVGVPTAGSIFKNVLWSRRGVDKSNLLRRFPAFAAFTDNPGLPAGFLIDECGLRGRKIGGAMISPKHANFIINVGGATAEDVITLISIAKEYVHRRFGLLLEEEIQYIGFEM
ncbi:MAG: UDP-N-acetylenolpyruvoylglucosamine reductase [Candidatus Sungbacteria bacterium RIFCSPLOWO2_01_FULL_59_16]|uniref:UDP-N-acetylenolpyruvoylglucosamine reductase n=1 Tax=Candidatus Sungbacteria bacterium RIFCSPLOWO2_01_FULL_59_16 TaxID=1802280 RepID=A0A1G2LA57_9BACT|nr:MAG: UDP-N-acetylenolpyruvoylglucosamine reductase [Candidatus Sungbacteria bacterium RIFCSPLOWO2_01_FULL_59_16]